MHYAKRQTFDAFLRQKGLKLTKERSEILSGLRQVKGHFSIESLVFKLKEQKRKVSRDTVYRNIPLLVEAGILKQSFRDKRDTYYEAGDDVHHHDHVICRKCGRVAEFHSETIERIQNRIAKRLGYKVEFHLHQLFGLCSKCR